MKTLSPRIPLSISCLIDVFGSGEQQVATLVGMDETPEGFLFIVETADGNKHSMTEAEFWAARDIDRTEEHISVSWDLPPDIHPTSRALLERKVAAACEVQTGDPLCAFYLGGIPNTARVQPDMDPQRVTKNERAARAVEKLRMEGIRASRPTIFRWIESLLARGPVGLIHGNSRSVQAIPQSGVEDELIVFLTRLAKKYAQRADISFSAFHEVCTERIHHMHPKFAEISSTRQRQLIRVIHTEHHLDQPQPQRESQRKRPERNRKPWTGTMPYQIVQADATVLNLECVDEHNRPIPRVELLVIIDVATRRCLAFDIIAGSAKSADVRRLLAQMTCGWLHPALTPSDLPWMPEQLILSDDLMSLPAGAIVQDLGPAYVAEASLKTLRSIGIDVMLAPPGRGDAKPVVEAFFRTWNQFEQTLPNYRGTSNKVAGSPHRRRPMLEVQHVRELFGQWLERVYHQRPQRRLSSPGSTHPVSPNELYATYSRAFGELTVQRDQQKVLALLDTYERTLGQYGINLDGGHYLDVEQHLHEAFRQSRRKDGAARRRTVRVWSIGQSPDWILVEPGPGQPLMVCYRQQLDYAPFSDVVKVEHEELMSSSAHLSLPARELAKNRMNIVDQTHDNLVYPLDRGKRTNRKPAEKSRPLRLLHQQESVEDEAAIEWYEFDDFE